MRGGCSLCALSAVGWGPKSCGKVRHSRVRCHDCDLLLVQSILALHSSHGGATHDAFVFRAFCMATTHHACHLTPLHCDHTNAQIETKQGGKFGMFGAWEGPGAYVSLASFCFVAFVLSVPLFCCPRPYAPANPRLAFACPYRVPICWELAWRSCLAHACINTNIPSPRTLTVTSRVQARAHVPFPPLPFHPPSYRICACGTLSLPVLPSTFRALLSSFLS